MRMFLECGEVEAFWIGTFAPQDPHNSSQDRRLPKRSPPKGTNAKVNSYPKGHLELKEYNYLWNQGRRRNDSPEIMALDRVRDLPLYIEFNAPLFDHLMISRSFG